MDVACRLAEAAGEVLLEHFGRITDVTHKGAVDLQTAADRDAEAIVLEGLSQAFPEDAILAEESGPQGSSAAPWCWIVDPLDGTTNFVHGLDHFAVSVGLSWQGELVGGVVHAPRRAATYRASRGGGAWCGGRRLSVSRVVELSDALLATGFPYDRRETAAALLVPVRRAMETAQGLRRAGAASLDFVDVARGALDGYWEPRLKPWDMAAGAVLVREAGGTVSAYAGRPFDVEGDTVVVSNGALHGAVVEIAGDGRA